MNRYEAARFAFSELRAFHKERLVAAASRQLTADRFIPSNHFP